MQPPQGAHTTPWNPPVDDSSGLPPRNTDDPRHPGFIPPWAREQGAGQIGGGNYREPINGVIPPDAGGGNVIPPGVGGGGLGGNGNFNEYGLPIDGRYDFPELGGGGSNDPWNMGPMPGGGSLPPSRGPDPTVPQDPILGGDEEPYTRPDFDFNTPVGQPNYSQALRGYGDPMMGGGIGPDGLPVIRQGSAHDPYLGNLNEIAASDIARQGAEDAIYNRATSRLDPRFEQESKDLEITLRNRGLSEGDAAFDSAMSNFGQSKNDAYQSAMSEAIMGGGAEAERSFGMDSSRRAQMFGEALGLSENELSRIGQQFGQDTSLRDQLYREGLGQSAQDLQAQEQQFGQQMTSSQYANQLRAMQIEEEMMRRNQPLNELNALLSGAQVQSPTFQSYNMAGRGQGADYAGAAQGNYNSGIDAYNAKNAQTQGWMSGIGSLMSGYGDL